MAGLCNRRKVLAYLSNKFSLVTRKPDVNLAIFTAWHGAYFLLLVFNSLLFYKNKGQHIYYKSPAPETVKAFQDTLRKTIILNDNSAGYIKNQFNYVLRFYPNMLVKTILVRYKKSTSIAKVKIRFSSIFKAPNQRVHKIYFSKSSKSTMESVILKKISFNSQLALMPIK